ncbi:acylphosphatase [Methylobacterium phyllostachyos]|uniref:acylphosphatase n=1 Tax=Methylobacterium phyllostachyos TaxID=582672 RepID=A0A1G9ZJT6_9HYPH|nr:acylphosphatase [Methylobacterium phyllostachyos]SDN21375.1 acylphosphatase [Methylobacterium phyllostachyos]
MHAIRTVSVVIQGRVQGVSYRVWTQGEARRLGLAGFVRNRDDGSVEARFSGAPEAVDAMLTLCRSGPPGARVTDMAVNDGAEAHTSPGFEILRS